MLDVNRTATIALTSALADWEAGYPPSLDTIREIRLAHSLLTEGEPSADELCPFLGCGWVIRGRSARTNGVNAVTESEYASAQVQALAARLGLPERFIAARLRDVRSAPHPRSAEAIFDLIDLIDRKSVV